MNDVEAMSEARAIAIYEAVNDDASTRTPWTHLSLGEWEKWRRAANVAQQVAGPQKPSWASLVNWWESGGEQWDELRSIVSAMIAAPQPEPRKPMTEDEINDAWEDALRYADPTVGNAHFRLARAVEAAHGIGWDNGLSQDYDRKMGKWLADQPGARHQLREGEK